MSEVRVYMDGSEVTDCCISGSWTRRLNRPATATVTMPMDCGGTGTLWPDAGSKLRIDLVDGTMSEIVFHGFVMNAETDTDRNFGTTVYNASDPMELWQWRVVRDDDGDFTMPLNFIERTIYAPSMVQAMLQNSIDTTIGGGGPPPTDAEGPLFLDIGPFASGSADCRGAPVDWPMTMAEFFSLLCSTGTVDVYITPIDDGVNMGYIEGYAGDFGTNLSGSVVFEYGQGAHNIDSLRWNRDMTAVVNKYWLFGGPRVKTAADPGSLQHWCFNVTGDDGGAEAGFTGGLPYPPGGDSVDTSNNPIGPPWTNNQLGAKIYSSRVKYGVRMKVDIFDAYDENCIPGFGTRGRWLYRRYWQEYSWFSAEPRELVHITPTRDTAIGDFDIGDLIGVECTSAVRGGFTGVQRVYGYTVSWENPDDVLTLSEIQTSADAEM